MPVLNFPPYHPDVDDLNQGYTTTVMNVLPQADGYGPFPGLSVFSQALPARPRGLFFGTRANGSVRVFAGTQTKLYALDNTTLDWIDVSLSDGTYSALDDNENWQFAQFNSKIIAVQANAAAQVIDIEADYSSVNFANLAGSPPQASHVTTVNRFLVLSGLNSNRNRIHWSGLNDIEEWTSGVNFSDFQDLPDGGRVQAVVGGEFGVILQDTAIRRMVFSPGSDIVFQIDRIAKDIGAVNTDTICDVGGNIYMWSTKGFVRIGGDGSISPIGKERVDRTFDATYDDSDFSLVQGAGDPNSHRVYWAYRSEENSLSTWDKGLVYDTILDRWAPFEVEGTFLASISRPGLTLEALATIGAVDISNAANNGSGLIRLTVTSTSGWTTGDIKTVADVGGTTEANGTWTITVIDGTNIDLQGSTYANAYTSGGYVEGSLDDLDVSLDSFAVASRAEIAAFNDDFRLCFFSGDNLEATLESSEQSAVAKRLFVRGVYPITDASDAYASVGRRENRYASPSYTSETAINTQGYCPQRASTRHARARLRIPEGATWTYATGVEPDVGSEGRR